MPLKGILVFFDGGNYILTTPSDPEQWEIIIIVLRGDFINLFYPPWQYLGRNHKPICTISINNAIIYLYTQVVKKYNNHEKFVVYCIYICILPRKHYRLLYAMRVMMNAMFLYTLHGPAEIQAVRGSTSLKKTPRQLPSTVAPFSSTCASLQRTVDMRNMNSDVHPGKLQKMTMKYLVFQCGMGYSTAGYGVFMGIPLLDMGYSTAGYGICG